MWITLFSIATAIAICLSVAAVVVQSTHEETKRG
jgi:hypothetical protein